MCGIIALIHKWHEEKCARQKCKKVFLQAYGTLKHRGPDSSGYVELNLGTTRELVHGWVGAHRLAMIGSDKQPVYDTNHRAWLVANCELYNYHIWLKRQASTSSDTKILLENILNYIYKGKMIRLALRHLLQELDGVFSFIAVIGEQMIVARDYWGVKPLYIGMKGNEEIALASEKKALTKLTVDVTSQFNPGSFVVIDLNPLSKNFLRINTHRFTPIYYQQGRKLRHSIHSYDEAIDVLHQLLLEALKKRITSLDAVGILLSGGLDSSILALILNELVKSHEIKVRGFIIGSESSKDARYTHLLEQYLDFPITWHSPTEEELEMVLPSVLQSIEIQDLKQLTIALPLALACQEVRKHEIRCLITGQGADELFGGYHRYREAFLRSPSAAREEMERDLLELAMRNLERDDKVAMHYGLELRLPYLDLKLSGFARNLPVDWKLRVISSTSGNLLKQSSKSLAASSVRTKVILRDLALKVGLPEPIIERKKTAFQYGSGVMKMLQRIAKKQGYKKLKDWFDGMIGSLTSSPP